MTKLGEERISHTEQALIGENLKKRTDKKIIGDIIDSTKFQVNNTKILKLMDPLPEKIIKNLFLDGEGNPHDSFKEMNEANERIARERAKKANRGFSFHIENNITPERLPPMNIIPERLPEKNLFVDKRGQSHDTLQEMSDANRIISQEENRNI